MYVTSSIQSSAGDESPAESSIKKIGHIRFVANNINRFRIHICKKSLYCDGRIHCPWFTPNDEANCGDCPSNRPSRCECNNKENFTCKSNGEGLNLLTCYDEFGKPFNR